MPENRDQVTIQLTRDEALVLFDWLHRCEDSDTVVPPEHHGEQVALWNLSALLEHELAEPFTPHYSRLVDEARERLGGDADGASDARGRMGPPLKTSQDTKVGSRSMGHRIMCWPVWARGVLAGTLFACFMSITFNVMLGYEWRLTVLGGFIGGVGFAVGMALVIDRTEKALDPADGPPLTANERVQAIQAANHGQPSNDPRIQAAAVTLAQQRIRQRGGVVPLAVCFGILALRAPFAVMENPWWWLVIAMAIVIGPLLIAAVRRQRKGATTLLALAGENATKR